MKRFAKLLWVLALIAGVGLAQKPKYPYNHVFHASVNTVTVYAEAYTGSSTVTMVNNAIAANVPPDRIVIDSHMSGNSCDFSGITLTSDQTSLVDLRQGKIAWGFKDPSSNSIICEVQSGGTGTFIETLTVNNFNGSGGTNGLTSGGAIYYTGTGYDYTVTRALYTIGGVSYVSPQTNISLAASDPTNPRIDTVYVDNTGSVGVLTGTPAPAPSQPSVDPTTQLQLGFITVPAGSTSPSGTATENIYLEDAGPPAEWGCATSGTGWNCADMTHPYQGTKDIQSLGTSASSYVHLTRSAAEAVSTYGVLFFALRTESQWVGKWEVWLTFYDGSTPVGNAVFAKNNSFGWNGKVTGAYQLIGIPLTAFNLSTTSVDGLRIKWNNGGTSATNATIYLDQIQLQNNGVQGGGSGGGGSSSGLTQVNGTADGVFFPNPIPSSTASGVETMDFSPKGVPANTAWLGPQGSPGSNVAVVQSYICSSTSSTITCPSKTLRTGDKIFVINPSRTGAVVTSFSSALGNTITAALTTGTGATHYYGFGTITTGGSDVITVTNARQVDNFSGTTYYLAYVVELAGTNAIVSANSDTATNPAGPTTINVTPSASTDSFLRFGTYTTALPTPAGTISIAPVGTGLLTVTSANTGWPFGFSDIYGPGSTSSVANVISFTHTGGGGTTYLMSDVIDLTQSATPGSGPGHYGTITPNYLSQSAKATVQSVNTFTIASAVNLPSATNTTVLTGAVTMPPSGCPCRVLLQSSIFLNSTTSAQWGWWASDGTNTFGWGASITTDAHTPPAELSGTSPVAYANNQAVTFSIIINPGTYSSGTVQALSTLSPPLPAAAKSWMTVTVLPSTN